MHLPTSIPTKKWLAGIAAALLFSCQEPTREAMIPQADCFSTRIVQELTRVDGQVEKVADFYVIQAGEQRYSTCGLPPELRVAGTRIQFDAKVYEIPPNVRLAATPVKITRVY